LQGFRDHLNHIYILYYIKDRGGGVINRSGRTTESPGLTTRIRVLTKTQGSGQTPRPGGTPPPRGGCSSYQRLSKFAGISGPPILKPGLRGLEKKTRQRRICDKMTQKGVKNASHFVIFGHFWGFFGHFWPFLAIFGHFWPFLTPPTPHPKTVVSADIHPKTHPNKNTNKYQIIISLY